MESRQWRSVIAVLAIAASVCVNPTFANAVSGQGTWETNLQDRDLDGNGVTDAFYDIALNITWLRNGNSNGLMTWFVANAWATNLTFGGYSGWRLPTIVDTGAIGCNLSNVGTDCGYNVQTKNGSTVYSEMAYLWYVELGNKAYYDIQGNPLQPGWGLTNTGNFQNMQANVYYSGLLNGAPNNGSAWGFDTRYGFQYLAGLFDAHYALAVRDGDLAAPVPEPWGFALLLIGLGVVLYVARRRMMLLASASFSSHWEDRCTSCA